MDTKSQVEIISTEIKQQLSTPSVARALLATTFKGLSEEKMRQAMMEGMLRGYSFQEFLNKDVYALPFGSGYTLIPSIDLSRKLAMRTGLYVGKSKPEFEMSDDLKTIISCTVTVKKITAGIVGEFSATVYFSEYDKKSGNWKEKPRTMIAKVAEMHALRMAFPEQLAKQYIEEEINDKNGVMGDRVEEAKKESKQLTMGSILKNNDKDNQAKETGEEIDVQPVDSNSYEEESVERD